MTPPINTVLQGDCVTVMRTLPSSSVDLILTDPPYITRYRSRDGRAVRNDDNDRWLKPAFGEIFRLLAPDSFAVSFYGWPQADKFMQAYREAGFRIVGHMTFPKGYASSTRYLKYSHECAHLLAKGNPESPEQPISDVLSWEYTGNAYHPTQKPLAALIPLVEAFSKPNDVVFDPFAGSGSSLLAAARLGRRYLGIELDANHYATARRRLRETQANLPIDNKQPHERRPHHA